MKGQTDTLIITYNAAGRKTIWRNEDHFIIKHDNYDTGILDAIVLDMEEGTKVANFINQNRNKEE